MTLDGRRRATGALVATKPTFTVRHPDDDVREVGSMDDRSPAKLA